MPSIIKAGETSTARRGVEFLLLASNGTPLTGQAGNVTVRILLGGTSSPGAGTVEEIDAAELPGLYRYILSTGEAAAVSAGLIRPSMVGAVSAFWPFMVVEYDAYEAEVTAASVAAATRAEMDANSTRLAEISSLSSLLTSVANEVAANSDLMGDLDTALTDVLNAVNATRIASGAVATGGASGATSVTLPSGLSVKEGDLLFFTTSKASAVVSSYTSGTGVAQLSAPGLNAAVANGEPFLAYQSPSGGTVESVWTAANRTLSAEGVAQITDGIEVEQVWSTAQRDEVLADAEAARLAAVDTNSRVGGLESALTTITNYVDELEARLTATRASALDSMPRDLSTEVEAIQTIVTRFNALLENSGGDRFTAKALETAPTGSGDSVWSVGQRDTLMDNALAARTAAEGTEGRFDAVDAAISTVNGLVDALEARLTDDRAAALDEIPADVTAQVEAIQTVTTRLNALIENVGGDRFTAKALEAGSEGERFDAVDAMLTTIAAYVDELETRLTAPRAAALDDIPADMADMSAEITTIQSVATRLNSLIENVNGDRLTAKALEAAPTGSGGGGDSVWTLSDKDKVISDAAAARAAAESVDGKLTTERAEKLDTVAEAGTEVELTDAAEAGIVDRLIGRNIKGGTDGGRTVGQAFAALRNRMVITDNGDGTGTLTVYSTDDVTVEWTAAVALVPRNAVASVDPGA